MTKADFIQKYGQVKVKFSSYHEFVFTFVGVTDDGNRVVVQYGGNSDDIYRMEVAVDCEENMQCLDPFGGDVYAPDNEILDNFYD